MTVDVLIPSYRPGKQLEQLIRRILKQSYPVGKILVMNTEEEYFPEELKGKYKKVLVHHLSKKEFDHGGTRDKGIGMSKADVVVCMTQDALPADDRVIEELLKPFADANVWAAYARQLPAEGCSEIEKYTRSFNYPKESCLKGREDLEKLGVKTYFCSNVCAAWRRDIYIKLGGFAKYTVFNEDMIYAGKVVQNGGLIAYCADAKVIHSHNYSMMQQFHRYFDLAVSQTMHPEIFAGVRSESEGAKLVKKTIEHCIRIGKPWLIIQVVTQNAGNFLGYKMGQKYQRLSKDVILWCTMNRSYWEKRYRE